MVQGRPTENENDPLQDLGEECYDLFVYRRSSTVLLMESNSKTKKSETYCGPVPKAVLKTTGETSERRRRVPMGFSELN